MLSCSREHCKYVSDGLSCFAGFRPARLTLMKWSSLSSASDSSDSQLYRRSCRQRSNAAPKSDECGSPGPARCSALFASCQALTPLASCMCKPAGLSLDSMTFLSRARTSIAPWPAGRCSSCRECDGSDGMPRGLGGGSLRWATVGGTVGDGLAMRGKALAPGADE